MKTNKQGFSFVELMIVITIMSILSVVSMVSYTSVTRKSRDSRRIADLQKMAMALEMARNVGRTYPADAQDLVTNEFIRDSLPTDPKTHLPYTYNQLNSGYRFTINAILEDKSSSETGTTLYTVTNP
jgi:prepilin-type N-terminal cleavage/methylation domain-containing protein